MLRKLRLRQKKKGFPFTFSMFWARFKTLKLLRVFTRISGSFIDIDS